MRKKSPLQFALAGLTGLVLWMAFQPSSLADVWRNPVRVTTLENGMKLYYQQDKASAVSAVQILVPGGRLDEPMEKKGLAYMAARFALEIPDDTKLQEIMSQATRIYLISMPDYSLITILSLSEHIDRAVQISAEIMRKPLISGIRISRLKETMEYLRESEKDDPENLAFLIQQSNLSGLIHTQDRISGRQNRSSQLRRMMWKVFTAPIFMPAAFP